MLPIIEYIERAKFEFSKQYGFPAETLHVSRLFERALHRWAYSQNLVPAQPSLQPAEVAGLQILRSTKKSSPHFEFWLSAVRDTQVHSIHVRLTPEEMGAKKTEAPEILLQTDASLLDD